MSEAKDGFDLLEYPCEFQFKAMVRVSGLRDGQSATQAMQTLLSEQGFSPVKTTNALSKTGKFESVSLTVKLDNREQLEEVYACLAESPNVVMTL